MKYTSILAGVLGLMALAACNDNEEATIERPKGIQKLTVTWGGGADTRLTFSEYDAKKGIKSTWDVNDEIGIVEEYDYNSYSYPYLYRTNEAGARAQFQAVSSPVDPIGEKFYTFTYPANLKLDGFDVSSQTGLYKDLNNYAFAENGIGGGDFDYNITLVPLCSFLYIPKGTVFPGLSGIEGDYSKATITLSGDNLINGLEADFGDYIKGNITIDAGADVALFTETSTDVCTAEDIFIAVPLYGVLKNLAFDISAGNAERGTHAYYRIVESKDNSTPVEILHSARVYKITSDNLQLQPSIS